MNIETKVSFFSDSTFHSKKLPISTDINDIKQALVKLSIIEDKFSWLTSDTNPTGYAINELLQVASVLTSATEVMSSRADGRSIASSLAKSIEKKALELLKISGLTLGGPEMMQDALVELLRGALTSESGSYTKIEDVFQVGLLDVVLNAETYGLNSPDLINKIGILLEKTGSGSHSMSDYKPKQLSAIAKDVWSAIYQKVSAGVIPDDSIILRVMRECSQSNNPSATLPNMLERCFTDTLYFNNGTPEFSSGNMWLSYGWVNDNLPTLSPMLRVSIYTQALKEFTFTPDERKIILSGSKAELDALMVRKTGKDALTYLYGTDDWQNTGAAATYPSGVSAGLDFVGVITDSALKEMIASFPGRDMTKEDIKEINNIGDQVKIIMQTLKYWITTTRDEQLSTSRNIA